MLKRRIVRWFATSVGVIVAFVVVVRSQLIERPAARLLEAALEVVTGEQALIGSLDLDPVRRSVEVAGLILTHSDSGGQQSPIVAAERVSVRLGLPWSGAWIHKFEIDRPLVHLHVDEDGLREFQDMELGASKSESLPWDRIEITNARVELDTAMGTLLLEGVDVGTTERDRVDVNLDTVRIQFPGVDEVARTVNWRDVTLTPEKLEIPDLRLESQHVQLQGGLFAGFGSELRGNMTATVALSMLNGLDEGEFNGLGHLDIELGGTIREPVIEGSVLVSDVVYRKPSGSALELRRFLAQVAWRGRTLDIIESELHWAEGTLYTHGAIDLISTGVELSTNFEGVDLRAAIKQAGGHQNSWTTFLGDGDIQASGTLNPFRLAGTYDIAIQDLDVGSGPPDALGTTSVLLIPTVQLDGLLELDGEGIWLRSHSARSGATSGSIDTFIGFSSDGPLDIEYSLDRASLATFRPLNNLDLWGFGRLRGTVKGPFQTVRFTANASMRDFHLLGAPMADKVDISFMCNDLKTLEFQRFKAVLGQTEYIGHADVVLGDELENTFGRLKVTH